MDLAFANWQTSLRWILFDKWGNTCVFRKYLPSQKMARDQKHLRNATVDLYTHFNIILTSTRSSSKWSVYLIYAAA